MMRRKNTLPDEMTATCPLIQSLSLEEKGISFDMGDLLRDENKQATLILNSSNLFFIVCLIANAFLSLFIIEKKRLWTKRHALPVQCDITECAMLCSLFLTFSGSILVCLTKDKVYIIPGMVAMLVGLILVFVFMDQCTSNK